MAGNKTIPNDQSVEHFLNAIEDAEKRTDSFRLVALMQEVTGLAPQMWGSSIIGFGSYHYRYASGREGDSILAGFSPRKQNLTLYHMGGLEQYEDLFKTLGKHTMSKGCLHIKRLDDVDLTILKQLVEASFKRASSASEQSES